MSRRLWPALLVAALCAGASASPPPSRFPFYKDLAPPPGEAGALAGITLDDDVLNVLNDRRTNLRLWDARGREVPYLLRTRAEVQTVREEVARRATVLSFQERPDNRAEIVVANDPSAGPALALVLHSGQADYEKRVDVYGSADRQAWTAVATNQSIFDYSRYIDVRNLRVPLAASSYPYYRIDISNLSEDRRLELTEVIRQVDGAREPVLETETARIRREPFRVDHLDIVSEQERVQARQPILTLWDIADFRVEHDATARVTRLEFDTRRQPLTRLWLIPRNRNFSRRVTVAGTDGAGDPAAWTELGSAVVTVVDVAPLQQAQLSVPIGPARRYLRYRVTLHDRDNPPLDIAAVRVEAESWEAIFFPPGGPVQMFYGGASDEAPDFDIGAVLSASPDRAAQAWSVGPPFPNPEYRAGAPRSPARSGRTLMVVAIFIMVALLFRVIARSARQLGPPAAPPPSS